MKHFLLSALFLPTVFSMQTLRGQGLIVNEMSNGTVGNKEYMEFIVVGSQAAPLAPVNLTGWIIDDNNGSFEAGVGTGVAVGHFRFTGTCFSAVPPGSIIVIYNAADVDAFMPAADITDSNGDGVYIVPHNSTCIEVCSTLPTTANSAYTPCTYVPTTLSVPANTSWSVVGFANNGDAPQVRRPDRTFYHGFAYGDVSVAAVRPNYPAEFGGGAAFNVNAASGSASAYAFDCGNWTSSAEFSRTTAASGTPGAANSVDNSEMITNLRNGTFNYADLNDPNNCDIILLSVDLLRWEGRVEQGEVQLRWALSAPDAMRFEVERSGDGISFHVIGELSAAGNALEFAHTDHFPLALGYYRLKIYEWDGAISYSTFLAFRLNSEAETNWILYPNPAREQLTVEFTEHLASEADWSVVDGLGRVVLSGKWAAGGRQMTVPTQTLPSGYYFMYIQTKAATYRREWIKG